MKIETMKISELTPHPDNPRKISNREMKGLMKSLEHFGLVQPIVYNERSKRVVGGHQRLRAMEALGHKEVPVCLVDLDPQKEKALLQKAFGSKKSAISRAGKTKPKIKKRAKVSK